MESPEGGPQTEGETSAAPVAPVDLNQVGTVKAWNEDRGFGFVQVEGVEGDVYVHRTVLQDGQTLVPGAKIQLSTSWDEAKGKMAATAVVGATEKGSGKGGMSDGGWSNWGGAKGGYDACGKGKGGYGWEKGGYCGDPWGGGGDWYGKGYGKDYGKGCGKDYGKDKGYGYGKDFSKGYGKDYGKGGKMGCCGGGPDEWLPRQTAWIEYWVEYEGYGCAVTEMGERVYIARSLTNGNSLMQGTPVYVEARWNWEKSGWQATFAAPGGGTDGKGKGKMMVNKDAGTQAPVATGQQSGTVKAWQDKGYGFISPENGGPDVFVHRNALQDGDKLEVGAHVQFDIQWDEQRQKYLALNCTGAVAGPTGCGGCAGGDMGKGCGPMGPMDGMGVADNGWGGGMCMGGKGGEAMGGYGKAPSGGPDYRSSPYGPAGGCQDAWSQGKGGWMGGAGI
mmetsp:Transcript_6411/g.14023  ORF Transcript_6411/g.14023 Transcript_6411/m.14023 type:complete len:447 (+) Transcript_6411:32-1372(+)